MSNATNSCSRQSFQAAMQSMREQMKAGKRILTAKIDDGTEITMYRDGTCVYCNERPEALTDLESEAQRQGKATERWSCLAQEDEDMDADEHYLRVQLG